MEKRVQVCSAGVEGGIWTDDVTFTYMALLQRSQSGYIPYKLAT